MTRMGAPPKTSLPVLESRSAVYGALPPRPPRWGAEGLPRLMDARGREITYLRLSVTDRCDLACVYCMPPGGEDDHAVRRDLLTFEEAARLVGLFASMGVRRVRFTGGEPLVRKDVVQLVEGVRRASGVRDLVLTTNATRLAELAGPLWEAGIRGVNVSLDSLDPATFARVTRGGDLAAVLEGIHAALHVGMTVKLNAVPMRGVNDTELCALVEGAWEMGVTPRFIELMPLGEGARLDPALRMGADEVAAVLAPMLRQAPRRGQAGHGPARYLEAADGSGHRVGFITALSDEFCGDCNRVRVSARGDVRACLADRRAVSLRDLMRSGASDEDVAWGIHWALGNKDTGHRFLDAAASEHERVGMSLIGG
jgi:GTP 3',8-cyclase